MPRDPVPFDDPRSYDEAWQVFFDAYERTRNEHLSLERQVDDTPMLGARWPFWAWLLICGLALLVV